MTDGGHLERIRIVLNRPRFPENIGAAARAALNMGIKRLSVVAPENYDLPRIRMLATHAAGDMVDHIHRCDTLAEAVSDCGFVVGTTARLGGERKVTLSPPVMAREVVALSKSNQVAVVFGSEDRGLTNEDLRRCHKLVTIPTASFSSLNLAQAVMVICYEISSVTSESGAPQAPRLASRHELDGMYDQLRDILVRISYINPENPDYWLNRLRQFFTRIQLRARDVSIIRGICRQVDWYARKNYEDGMRAGLAGSSRPDDKEVK
ncbi:MAG: RNA methyltransferase [Desulfobacterales bacterium]|jgi:tRNA/rRNA methyltransferase